jgi:CRISPR-associated protein Csa2
MFISVASRFIANIEALNAVESVGNVTKHRRAPIIVFDEKTGYTIKYVPAISGESLAHAYQANVIEFAKAIYKDEKVPLCKWCARGEFLKEMSMDYMIDEAKKTVEKLKSEAKEKQGEKKKEKKEREKEIEEKKHEFEKTVIKNCLVEDIGGFLSAEEFPVKRTSAFQTSYIIPTLDTLKATIIDTQFHTRHAPIIAAKIEEKERKGSAEEEEVKAQMIYYVEIASAIYGLYMNIDLDAIGKTRLVRIEDVVGPEERKRRILAALGGLALTINGQFGAKRSRFHPITEIKSVLLSVSKYQPFSVTPPHTTAYIKLTAERSKSFSDLLQKIGIPCDIKLFAYNKESDEKVNGVQYFDNVESLFDAVISYVMSVLK